MTEPERAALDHIRQVVDSVIGVPAPPEPPPPGPTVSLLPVPYVSQLGGESGIPTNDPGVAAAMMLVRAYVEEAIPLADFYQKIGESADDSLSFTQIMNALSVNAVPAELRSNLKLADLSLILFSGRPVIAPIKQPVLQQAGLTPEIFDGPFYVVVVGMDVSHVFIHDPLRKDENSQGQAIPWLTFYQAWSQAQGYVRAVLVPRQQLIRRVRVTASALDVFEQLDGTDADPIGTVALGDVFEVTTQKSGWGEIGKDRWINLSYTADI